MTRRLLQICMLVFAASTVGILFWRVTMPEAPQRNEEAEKIPAALERRLARLARFAPSTEANVPGSPNSFADQDWIEHTTDGEGNGPVDFATLTSSRNDFARHRRRPALGTGAWVPLGPVNGINDMNNAYRDRSVYNAGTENFSGRTVHAVISPDCGGGECKLWIANSNGGVWFTQNALAEDNPATAGNEGPRWEYLSGVFAGNNVASLALDPNDSQFRTIWAGTGEPNACGSGCEAGVGIYVSTNGGRTWKGPLGVDQFAARAVGSIEVKPGNSDTIFVASGRAVNGVSNTCCGGTDALIPGAPHFGMWRSLDRGATWELVNQGAPALCTAATPDAVSLNTTACSPRGARRVKIDPSDPNTVYASFFARGIWRSRSNGDPGTWEQIMPRLGPASGNAERAEFDVVLLPSGETRMYVGVGGGGLFARFRRNENVRSAPAATVLASWIDLTSSVPDTPGYSSFGFCDGQCSYDSYVYAPATNAPRSGANHDVVYLSGANQYVENNFGSGRSNGRAVLVSTDAGATFTDLTEDAQSNTQPGALHPDHHALVVNPHNWQQFFDFGDGGVNRSNGVFVNESADCAAAPKSYTGARRTFCEMVLARVPERLTAINRGLRTLHFYQVEYDRNDPNRMAGGTQDNGSWETIDGDFETWMNVNVADGGHNAFDAPGGDSEYALTGFQSGQLSVRYRSFDQSDVNWSADTMFYFYANEGVPFIGNAITDPVTPGSIWHGREHVFRSTNWGRNPLMTKEQHREHCSIWFGDGDVDEDGVYEPNTTDDTCDDFKTLGDPGPNGRLTAPLLGDRAGGHVAVLERAYSDTSTLWAATSTGRVFVSKNADAAAAATVAFVRLDTTDTDDPPRYPTAIFVDRTNPNRAWISYSGYTAKTPATPGHVFEVVYDPSTNTAAFTNIDATGAGAFGDIPANSLIVTTRGDIYVGTDYGILAKPWNKSAWQLAAPGLPALDVADLVYSPERSLLFAGTHGQGIWQLKVQ